MKKKTQKQQQQKAVKNVYKKNSDLPLYFMKMSGMKRCMIEHRTVEVKLNST